MPNSKKVGRIRTRAAKARKILPYWDRPCADAGLTSYHYQGAYGWVMIGAKDHDDALREARRSVCHEPLMGRLQVWNGTEYIAVE